jgi:thermostable 8-oxoguanine DNA glycosylase
LEVFAPDRQDEELEELLYDELSAPKFEPRRKDGGLRRYRYPRRKAAQIVACRSWLDEIGLLTEALLEVPCERARRRLLCDCPGLGPKSASWLLRNCGLSEGLAILDVHVLRILAGTGRLEPVSMPRDYEFAERVYLGWCAELGASAAAFDLLLWEFSRALRP